MVTFSTANQNQDPRVVDLFYEAHYILRQLRAIVNDPIIIDGKADEILLWAKQFKTTYSELMDISGGQVTINL